jgi:hypothetical protein
MKPIPEAAQWQCGVFTTEQAASTGWSRLDLSRRVADGSLVALRRGAYLAAEDLHVVPERELGRFLLGRRGVAAALRIPAAAVSHLSAAALCGLPLLESAREFPCVTIPPERRTRPAALHVHRQPITGTELARQFDFAVTSVPRTCLDVTRECGLVAGLVTADAALHLGLVTKPELRCAYDRLQGRAGLADGRALIDMASGLSESPLESISRFAMRGLSAQPEQQATISDASGLFVARVDFLWRREGLVGEADGRAKYTADELYREKRRGDALAAAGLVISRWDWATAMHPHRLRAQLERDLNRARSLRAAGYRSVLDAA